MRKINKSFFRLVAKQPNLFSEIYEILFYCVTQMLQLNEALERCDDIDLNDLYKKVLGYKDSLNGGISSPMSVGSDTSLDGVRFFNGNIENETNVRNPPSIENSFSLQNDPKFDKIRGSSDLNACMIIAEAYNSGYKHLDLFASNWNGENELSEEDNRTEGDDDSQSSEQNHGNEVTLNSVEDNIPSRYPVVKCNGHAINDAKNDLIIKLNGVDNDLALYKDEMHTNPLTKISLKL